MLLLGAVPGLFFIGPFAVTVPIIVPDWFAESDRWVGLFWGCFGGGVFAGSIGRSDLPGGDFRTLMASMRTRVMTLPDDTRVLPGHGPETTIGRVQDFLPLKTCE